MLPVDDALLGDLKPVGGEEAALAECPPVLKKLSIAAGVSGSILRAWDFLHLNAQVPFVLPLSLLLWVWSGSWRGRTCILCFVLLSSRK